VSDPRGRAGLAVLPEPWADGAQSSPTGVQLTACLPAGLTRGPLISRT